ncbi:MAG: hypothetical protein GMKNLPBB_00930 [Myxococcota bacterium]|nr:hypothetical protein [Myxococcota bacterium]
MIRILLHPLPAILAAIILAWLTLAEDPTGPVGEFGKLTLVLLCVAQVNLLGAAAQGLLHWRARGQAGESAEGFTTARDTVVIELREPGERMRGALHFLGYSQGEFGGNTQVHWSEKGWHPGLIRASAALSASVLIWSCAAWYIGSRPLTEEMIDLLHPGQPLKNLTSSRAGSVQTRIWSPVTGEESAQPQTYFLTSAAYTATRTSWTIPWEGDFPTRLARGLQARREDVTPVTAASGSLTQLRVLWNSSHGQTPLVLGPGKANAIEGEFWQWKGWRGMVMVETPSGRPVELGLTDGVGRGANGALEVRAQFDGGRLLIQPIAHDGSSSSAPLLTWPDSAAAGGWKIRHITAHAMVTRTPAAISSWLIELFGMLTVVLGTLTLFNRWSRVDWVASGNRLHFDIQTAGPWQDRRIIAEYLLTAIAEVEAAAIHRQQQHAE